MFFVVRRQRGGPWDWSRDLREQDGWDEHARFMDALVAEYATNFPPMIADFRMDQFRKSQSEAYFAWLGGVNPGEGHYYLLRTPAFLIEYDNTQNGNNHIHSVWRDFNGDFGQDLLGGHYTAAH